MSLSSEITRLQNAKSALKTSIEAKGVTVSDSTLISGYAALVDEIQTGGGGGDDILRDLIERDITTLNIPSGTTQIGEYAFFHCSKLTSVEIPNSVTSIGTSAFEICTGLTSVEIPNSVKEIGSSAFSNCTVLTSVSIGNSVTSIGRNAFGNCIGLMSVNISNSVTTIGNYAFNNCTGLTSVSIGNSVTSIGNQAFSYCSGLTSITIQATTPPTLSTKYAFNNTNNCPIYVPAESVDAYKTATNWSELANRIQAIVA